MTNQEARKCLEQWLKIGSDGMTDERLGYIEGWFHKSDKEAFNMAIKALEQEPTDRIEYGTDGNAYKLWVSNGKEYEPSGDLISRQAVLEMAYDMSEIDGEHFTEPCMVVDVEDIQKLPPVNPQEPKTGHWIPTYGNVKCSVCGSVKESRRVGKATHYCDFCGARMVEQERSDKE